MSSDKKEVSDEVTDAELTKEQKLEIAKKKFADLKKKNKKKKKKEEGDEGREETPDIEKDQREETPDVEKDQTQEASNVEKDQTQETSNIEKLGDLVEQEDDNATKVASKAETTQVQGLGSDKVEAKGSVNDWEKTPAVDSLTSKLSEDYIETVKNSSNSDNLLSDKPKSKYVPKSEENTSELSIEELTKQVNLQQKTITKLRDENTDLKLLKMDLQDKITELEQEIQQLKLNSNSQKLPGSFVAPPIEHHQPPVQKLPPVKPVYTRNEYASASKQDLSQFDIRGDFRESLMLWKNWQVDMTLWNGSSTTKQFQL